MLKRRQGQKPPKSKKPPGKLLKDAVYRAATSRNEASNQEVGDMADKITRAPKKKR